MNTVLKNMEELMEQARRSKKKTIGVVAAEDEDVLEAVKTAVSANIARAILIGDEGKIKNLIEKIQLASAEIEIINQPVPQKAALQALDLFHSRKIDLLMKGDITTGTFLRVLLNKENGVRTDKILSHVGVFEVDGVDKLMYLSDAAINIKPDIQEKVDICKNAIYVAHCLGNTEPNLALITPFERVELDSIPSSVDAALIAKMGDCGQIKGAKIEGPISLDLAVSRKAARVKGYSRPIAGEADIFIVNDIDAGNVFYKGLVYFARARMAGVVAGAKAPIILTSRADSEETKLLSIALSIVIREVELICSKL
ncbi:MAG TPA: bifunctional enoyl-CoA hydratase/phosphate acetyltransferase [Candidatus Eremiobacteraeota bacterium]|nr:MAG: Phosphate acetyltransferase [bacterium ADurb.Bin363]HPZ06949.1 bifunctional enoyl-CoA hydratase/phosphate acetyltransferase [Candidatus Eremiobacteraeota bacterium]